MVHTVKIGASGNPLNVASNSQIPRLGFKYGLLVWALTLTLFSLV